MEKKYIVLVLCVLGYIGAVLGGMWQIVPADIANNGKDAMMAIIAIIVSAIMKGQSDEIRKLKLKLGM